MARSAQWRAAALVVIVISLGWAISGAPRNTPSRDLLNRSVGLTVLAAGALRHGVIKRDGVPERMLPLRR